MFTVRLNRKMSRKNSIVAILSGAFTIIVIWASSILLVQPQAGAREMQPLPNKSPSINSSKLPKSESSSEWPTYGLDAEEQRHSPLSEISRKNVKRLGVAWTADVDTDRGQEATPLMVGGVVYITTAWSKVYAFDATTGAQLWYYDPKVRHQAAFDACCDVVNRGAAFWEGRLYFGSLDGRLIALDAKTGRVVWDVQTTDATKPYTITGAPRIIKGMVVIGNGGAEYGVRGYVSAYDAITGKRIWRFYTTPNPNGKADHEASDKVLAEKAGPTWSDGLWKQTGGGGTVWDSIVYDPKSDFIYFGVGNGSPWNHKLRSGGKGDNLFLSSIVAVNAKNGAYIWHYQTTPGESWDYTATQPIMIADLIIDGIKRRVVMQAPKNGFFYVLDALTGKLISATKYAPVNWAERVDLRTGRPVEAPFSRYEHGTTSRQITGPAGAHSWQPMAFDPHLGLVFIPAMESAGNYVDPVNYKFTPGLWNLGQKRTLPGPSSPPEQVPSLVSSTGKLIAWDPVLRKARWTRKFPIAFTSGTLSTAGGLVFHAAGRDFAAYDAATGDKLWSYKASAYIIAPPIAYQSRGTQYIAVLEGWGGSTAAFDDQPRQPGRLFVFKLGGSAKPTRPHAVVTPSALDLTNAEPSAGDADRGAVAYRRICFNCHGAGVFLPDLSRSSTIVSKKTFSFVVLDGPLASNGMIGLKKFMSTGDVEDVRAYLLWRANGKISKSAVSSSEKMVADH